MAATTPIVEFLATTSMGEKGQLTVPKQFRDDLGLKPGAPVTVLRMGNGLILIPEQERLENLCKRVSDAMLEQASLPNLCLKHCPMCGSSFTKSATVRSRQAANPGVPQTAGARSEFSRSPRGSTLKDLRYTFGAQPGS